MTPLLLSALLVWGIPEGNPPDRTLEPVDNLHPVLAEHEGVAGNERDAQSLGSGRWFKVPAGAADEDRSDFGGEDDSGSPEPLTLLLFGSGIVGLALSSRRARRAIQGH